MSGTSAWRAVLILFLSAWAAAAQAAPPLPPPSSLEAMATCLERAEHAPSRAACLDAIAEAEVLARTHEKTLPRSFARTLEAARSATWPRYTRRLLASLRTRVASGITALRATASATGAEDETARTRLQETLDRSEFTWSKRVEGFMKRLAEWLRQFFAGRSHEKPSLDIAPWWATTLQWALVTLVIVALAWLLALALRGAWRLSRRKRPRKQDEEPAPTTLVERLLASGEWLQRARAEVSRGDCRSAVRCLFMALLVRLGEQRRIRVAPGQTNWDVIRQWQGNPRQPDLESATRLYEEKWYGMRSATTEDVERMQHLHDHLVAPGPGAHEDGP